MKKREFQKGMTLEEIKKQMILKNIAGNEKDILSWLEEEKNKEISNYAGVLSAGVVFTVVGVITFPFGIGVALIGGGLFALHSLSKKQIEKKFYEATSYAYQLLENKKRQKEREERARLAAFAKSIEI